MESRTQPRDIIEEIRKYRFEIDLNLENASEEVKRALEDKNQILKNLAKLASEIHSRNPHFALELIQNAEDNKYSPEEKPELDFILNDSWLIIQNNELGFSEKDVDSICNIGGSNKQRSEGYIGEKGIGFKSVFMIADKVQIYSNGYRFAFNFDRKLPETMIKPVWLDKIPDIIIPEQTNILLHLNKEIIPKISGYLDQIKPELLLFMKKLKTINIRSGKEQRLISKNNFDSRIELRDGENRNNWRIVSTRILC